MADEEDKVDDFIRKYFFKGFTYREIKWIRKRCLRRQYRPSHQSRENDRREQ